MANYKFTKKTSASVVAVLFIILQVANTAQAVVSYEDFLQSIHDVVASVNDNLPVSELPEEVLILMKEIYETKILKDFPKATKGELTKMLINDVTSREAYYEKNKKIFEAFILKAMDADLKNYPDEKSGINPADVAFLSLMTRATVDKIIEDTIAKKKAPVDDSWKVLTLVDAFRTVYYYCKYPKELAPFLTEKMRVDVKEWLDSTATWGTWGFEDDESDANDNTSELKIEL